MKKLPIKKRAVSFIDAVDDVVDRVGDRIGQAISPVRKGAFERFPVLFTLLVTSGLIATMRGTELVLMKIPWLYNNPWLLLAVGVGILVLTGTLYKKLG